MRVAIPTYIGPVPFESPLATGYRAVPDDFNFSGEGYDDVTLPITLNFLHNNCKMSFRDYWQSLRNYWVDDFKQQWNGTSSWEKEEYAKMFVVESGYQLQVFTPEQLREASMRFVSGAFNSAVIERGAQLGENPTINLADIYSNGIASSFYLLSQTGYFVTSSLTDVGISGYSCIPQSGKYFVDQRCVVSTASSNKSVWGTICIDGFPIPETIVQVTPGNSNNFNSVALQWVVNVNGSQTVDARFRTDSTATIGNRSLTLIRLS